MMVMVMLSAAVISAICLQNIFQRIGDKYIFIALILGLFLFVEFLPKPLPITKVYIPEYVNLLKDMPKNGGMIDAIDPPFSLYYQTIHEIPIATGYISRYPTSV